MKSILAILPSLLGSILLLVQTKLQNTHTNNASNTARAKTIRVDDLIKWRRHIHENAQVSFKEEDPGKYVESIRKHRNHKPAKTSVIGILKD